MNEKITEVFQEIFSSKDLLSKFMLIDDVDELYEFCSNIKKGYSKAEFEDFLMELADECLFQTQSIGSETEKIAGGVNKFKKFISGSLAAATILTSTGIKAAETDSDADKAASSYTDLEPINKGPKIIETEEKTFFQKVKEKFQKVGSKIWENKGKIAFGAAILTAIVATAICINSNPSNPKYEYEEGKIGPKEDKIQPEKATVLSSIFKLGTLGLTSTMLLVDKLAKFLGGITKIGETVGKGVDIMAKIKANGEIFGQYLADTQVKSFEEREQDFYDHLKFVRGQEKAVNKLKEIMQDISKTQQITKEAEKTGKEAKNHPRIIILNGPSGSGKTLCAEMLAKSLSPNGEYKKIAAQNIRYDGSTKGDAATPAEEVFNFKPYYFGAKDNIGKYAIENPDGVVILDEYDKIGLGNGYSGVMEGDVLHPLDATFQSIYDNGCYENPNSKKIPLENFTFILTTNEKDESLGLPKREDKFAAFRTAPNHSSHFKDRFKNSVVTFDSLDENAFKQIAEDDLKSRLDLYMTLDVCGKCKFKVKNDVYEKIAQYIMQLKDDAEKDSKIVSPPSARIIVDCHNGITAEAVRKINSLYEKRQKYIVNALFEKYGKELGMSDTDIAKKIMLIPGKMTFTIDFNYHRDENDHLVKDGFTIECIDYGNYSDGNLENLKNLIKK